MTKLPSCTAALPRTTHHAICLQRSQTHHARCAGLPPCTTHHKIYAYGPLKSASLHCTVPCTVWLGIPGSGWGPHRCSSSRRPHRLHTWTASRQGDDDVMCSSSGSCNSHSVAFMALVGDACHCQATKLLQTMKPKWTGVPGGVSPCIDLLEHRTAACRHLNHRCTCRPRCRTS